MIGEGREGGRGVGRGGGQEDRRREFAMKKERDVRNRGVTNKEDRCMERDNSQQEIEKSFSSSVSGVLYGCVTYSQFICYELSVQLICCEVTHAHEVLAEGALNL
jgi:hypothetical protein